MNAEVLRYRLVIVNNRGLSMKCVINGTYDQVVELVCVLKSSKELVFVEAEEI